MLLEGIREKAPFHSSSNFETTEGKKKEGKESETRETFILLITQSS
jgi:hypothetical protein